MGAPGSDARVGGWTVGPVVGRRPAGVARDAVHPGRGGRAVLVVVDERFSDRLPPDADLVARAAVIGSPAVLPMLDAGLLDDGTRWYVTPPAPAAVLDPAAGCSPRRAAAIVEGVAVALAAVHAAGLVHGLVGPQAVVPASGRHAGGAVGTTLLLDTGVAALLGDRAAALAEASGVSLPPDRGQAADVSALGSLLLRLLTAAAPVGSALAALPVQLRGLLGAMLDEDPARRPTADAVARALAGLREGLLGTGAVDVPRRPSRPLPAAAARAPAAAPSPASVLPAAPRTAVPAPVHAPIALGSPIEVPRTRPDPAPSLRTGPMPVQDAGRSAKGRGRKVLLAAGGVGLAGLLIGVLSHLPTGQDAGVATVAAAEDGAAAARPAPTEATLPVPTTTAAPTGRAKHRTAAAAGTSAGAATPAFVRPTALVPSPLAASATATAPSRNTPTTRTTRTTSTTRTTTTRTTAPPTTAPPTTTTPTTNGATPTQDPTAPAGSDPVASDPVASDPTASDPVESQPSQPSSASGSASPDASASAAPAGTATPSGDPTPDVSGPPAG